MYFLLSYASVVKLTPAVGEIQRLPYKCLLSYFSYVLKMAYFYLEKLVRYSVNKLLVTVNDETNFS
jgi:hypothetical protein